MHPSSLSDFIPNYSPHLPHSCHFGFLCSWNLPNSFLLQKILYTAIPSAWNRLFPPNSTLEWLTFFCRPAWRNVLRKTSQNTPHTVFTTTWYFLLFIRSMSIISRMKTGISSILLTPTVHCLIQCLANSRRLTNLVNVWIISFRQAPNQPGRGYVCMYYYYILKTEAQRG